MVLRIIPIVMLALVPTLPNLAEAQQSRRDRQRTPEQEARREARRTACREEARIVYGTQRDKSRQVMQQYVRDCMRRNRQ